MPGPAIVIPALTAIARFVLAKGTREAVKKYGRGAVTKAKDLIKKREKAIARQRYQRGGGRGGKRRGSGRGAFNREKLIDRDEYPRTGRTPSQNRKSSPAEQREIDIIRNERMAASEFAKNRSRAVMRAPREGVPLKLKKGGKVRGAGRAIRGVRPCKMY